MSTVVKIKLCMIRQHKQASMCINFAEQTTRRWDVRQKIVSKLTHRTGARLAASDSSFAHTLRLTAVLLLNGI